MTSDQEKSLQEINDSWGVHSWKNKGDHVLVRCDDGDEIMLFPDGAWEWVE